jgi:hypothetical protein
MSDMVLASAGVRGQAERTGGLQLPPDALQAVVQAREAAFVCCLLEPTEANATAPRADVNNGTISPLYHLTIDYKR